MSLLAGILGGKGSPKNGQESAEKSQSHEGISTGIRNTGRDIFDLLVAASLPVRGVTFVGKKLSDVAGMVTHSIPHSIMNRVERLFGSSEKLRWKTAKESP